MTRKILKKSTKKRNTDPVCKIHVFQVAENINKSKHDSYS